MAHLACRGGEPLIENPGLLANLGRLGHPLLAVVHHQRCQRPDSRDCPEHQLEDFQLVGD
jgi:hypothetical protein